MAIKYNGRDLLKRIFNGKEVQKVIYNGNQIWGGSTPPVEYDYLNFTAVDGDVGIKLRWPSNLTPPAINFEISWDKIDWIDYTIGDYITILEGKTLYWRNKSETPDWESGGAGFFDFYMSGTGKVEAHGSVMYLLCKIHSLVIPFTSAFQLLFRNCDKLITAPELPATTLSSGCYQRMFQGCSSLTTPPTLPATTLATSCYANMFGGCYSLTTAPALPATTLADSCYEGMFGSCGLTTPPTLPATTLAYRCYANMFSYCYSLTTAPALPATTLTDGCYEGMFGSCELLTTVPALPATTLAYRCYREMFVSCSGLADFETTSAPSALPATTLAERCYERMFAFSNIRVLPKMLASYYPNHCCNSMFAGCKRIKISETETGQYSNLYRIPYSGTGTGETYSFAYMFENSGGPDMTGTYDWPGLDTAYYTSNTVV